MIELSVSNLNLGWLQEALLRSCYGVSPEYPFTYVNAYVHTSIHMHVHDEMFQLLNLSLNFLALSAESHISFSTLNLPVSNDLSTIGWERL